MSEINLQNINFSAMTLVQFKNKPQRSFNNLMDSLFTTMPSILRDDFVAQNFRQNVPVNIIETEVDYRLEVVAPGWKKEDFRINVDNNTLTVSAERNSETEEKNEKYVRNEYEFKSFNRSFTIDESIEVENIVAKYENGVLTLNLPKKTEVKGSSKEISIQ
jgi:HSP20 family protein